MWLIKLGVWITAPFGTSLDIANRKPWEAVETYLTNTRFKKIYGGFAFISSGKKS
jgi:demethylmenaquinone methyltransferase/2-methoxy-6-polyprenyl-1,4-benzoquinol methylase